MKLTKLFRKSMKIALNLSLFLFVLVIFGDKSFSLTDYQIKKFCKNEKRESICIKKFQEKKTKMQEGYLIEIPVIPFKR